MSTPDILTPAAQQVCSELTPLLRGYARENGLAADLADSLTLTWDGENFLATSPKSFDIAEYGDGKGAAPRPVHKAMNRLELDAEGLLTQLLEDRVAGVAESVRF